MGLGLTHVQEGTGRTSWLVFSNFALLVIALLQQMTIERGALDISTTQEVQNKFNTTNRHAPVLRNDTVLYGLIHVAKTAGTTVNGELVVRYERVCGNRGYSFDALRNSTANDSYAAYQKNYDRGRVPPSIMTEVGFADCDYVTSEQDWTFWEKNFASWPFPVELHLPCRHPIDHLYSQCNMRMRKLTCTNKNITFKAQKCLIQPERFSKELLKRFTVKCFNSRNVEGYIAFMGERLQTRKIVEQYTHRSTNRARRGAECLWKPKHRNVTEKVMQFLVGNYDYYDFCVNECMGSENELQLPTFNSAR